ncbi:Os09g0347900, partial [Oryza sativa Japonica Group]
PYRRRRSSGKARPRAPATQGGHGILRGSEEVRTLDRRRAEVENLRRIILADTEGQPWRRRWNCLSPRRSSPWIRAGREESKVWLCSWPPGASILPPTCISE